MLVTLQSASRADWHALKKSWNKPLKYQVLSPSEQFDSKLTMLWHCTLQEWEPYETDMAVPLTRSDLSLKVELCTDPLPVQLICRLDLVTPLVAPAF